MKNDNTERTMDGASEIVEFYESEIQDYLAGGEKRQVTATVNLAVQEFGVPQTVAYAFLTLHLHNHPQVMAKLGRDGGIVRREEEEKRRAEDGEKQAKRSEKASERLAKSLAKLTPEQAQAKLAELQALVAAKGK